MAGDPRIRASDADRDKTAGLLREHYAAGRLTAEEFAERLDAALAARTLGDIDALLEDLPPVDPYPLPDARLPRGPDGRPGRHSDAWRSAWGSWFTITVVCFVLWALSGRGYLWPLWVAAPWGVIMLGRRVSGAHPGGGRRAGGPGGGRAPLPGPADPHRGVTGGEVPPDVVALAAAGRRLEAIRRYRELTGASLTHATAVVGSLGDAGPGP